MTITREKQGASKWQSEKDTFEWKIHAELFFI